MTKVRMYIDEVVGNSDNPNHRFLSLTGVAVDLDYVKDVLHPELEDLKRKYFGAHPDEPVILHRKEMLSGKSPFHALTDSTTRTTFDKELLGFLANWEYTVFTVCLDKRMESMTVRKDEFSERSLFRYKKRPFRARWLSPSTSGKPDCVDQAISSWICQ